MRTFLKSLLALAILPAAAFAGPIEKVDSSAVTGFTGVHSNDAMMDATGYVVCQSPNGFTAAKANRFQMLTDGDTTNSIDTWLGSQKSDTGTIGTQHNCATAPRDFAGLQFNQSVKKISQIKVTMLGCRDGGWWNTTGDTDELRVQISTAANLADNYFEFDSYYSDDAIWQDVAFTSDCGTISDNDGNQYNNAANGAPAKDEIVTYTFTLDTPVDDITAIRIMGAAGGNAGIDTQGFIAVTEIEAYAETPEPATIALLAAGGVALLRRRKSKKA